MPRILYIGFGMEPFMRGGAITYQESILEMLQARGWEVFFYLSAPRYTYQNTPRLKRWLHKGINILELVDPPYHYDHHHAPSQQCYHPDIERLSKLVLEEVNPDLVHIHELQFHTVSLIDVIADMGIAVMKTMHNYYDLCPESNLIYQRLEPCFNFDNGRKCTICLSHKPVFFTNFKIRLGQALPLRLSNFIHNYYLKILKILRSKKTELIDNTIYTSPYHPDEYQYRRKFFIERLNRLDVIHCSAHRTAEIFCEYGVAMNKIKIIPLSVKKQEYIKPKALRGTNYPVVFGFIGGKSLHKGYHILINAFSRLDQKKARLIIWGDDKADAACRDLNVEYREKYGDNEINELFGEVDIFVVPSVWEEIFGIIGIECRTARIPVIGSRIGGIPEWLKDGESGFLVTPNDPEELAFTMKSFVDDPAMISNLQRRIKPWIRFDDHVNEMLQLYKTIIEKKKHTT